jgi:hypothetical protein
MSPPKKFQSSLKLLTTVSPYYWHPAPSKRGSSIYSHAPSRKSPTKWHRNKVSSREHNASYRYNHASKPTLKLPLGVSSVRPKLGIQCSQIPLFYPLAYWNLSMKQGSLLFCFVLFVLMRSMELGCFSSHSWSLWKAVEEEGCIGLVSWRLDLWCGSSWILNDFFTKN